MLGVCAALALLFGDQVVAEPIVGNETIGTITDGWSQTFASIQHAHAMLVSILVTAESHLLFKFLSRTEAAQSVQHPFLTPLSLLQMMISFSLFIWGCHDWLIPDDLAPLPVTVRRLIFRVDACFFLMTVNPPLLRCVRVRLPRAESAVWTAAVSLSALGGLCAQVLTINVLVPMAAGIFPAAQPWLLWAVYSLFTSHLDIAFHTTV